MPKITEIPKIVFSKLFIVVFIILFFFYLFLNIEMRNSGFISEREMYFSVRSVIASISPYGLFQSSDLSIPPLQIVVMGFLCKTPILISSLIGALFVSFLLMYIFSHTASILLKVVLTVTLISSPSILFLVCIDPVFISFLFLLSLSFYFLLEFSVREQVFYLFIFALLYGILFFLLFEIIWTVFFLIFFFYLIFSKAKTFKYFIIAALFPLVFLFLSWIYIYWIFAGNPLVFFKDIFIVNAGIGWNSLINDFPLFLKENFIFLLIYGIVISFIGKFKSFFSSPLFFIFLSPFVISVLIILSGYKIFFSGYSILFLANFLLLLPSISQLITKKLLKNLLYVFFLSFLIFDFLNFFAWPLYPQGEFRDFMIGKVRTAGIEAYSEVAEKFDSGGKILVDEKRSFQVLYFTENPERFTLSFYPEFNTYLINPEDYVSYLLVNKSGDKITSEYPYILDRGISGFNKISESDLFVIYEKNDHVFNISEEGE